MPILGAYGFDLTSWHPKAWPRASGTLRVEDLGLKVLDFCSQGLGFGLKV